ncbi:hypothetical protein MG296_10500 [Flavobacteriaceae bacterium TK19130]|nr:hypothetical protein [Thermobacterium salinum]
MKRLLLVFFLITLFSCKKEKFRTFKLNCYAINSDSSCSPSSGEIVEYENSLELGIYSDFLKTGVNKIILIKSKEDDFYRVTTNDTSYNLVFNYVTEIVESFDHNGSELITIKGYIELIPITNEGEYFIFYFNDIIVN